MNSSSLPPLALALGLIVGAGVGFLLGQGSGSARASESPSDLAPITRSDFLVEPGAPEAPEMATVDATASAPSATKPQDGSSELTPTELRRAERAASSAARIEQVASDGRDPSWMGTISGALLDESGAVLVGATVMTYGKTSWNSSEVTARSTHKIGRGGSTMTLDVEKIPEESNGWSAFGAQTRPRSSGR